MPLKDHFSFYTPTLYFKASLKNFPQTSTYNLQTIFYLHYFPWPVTLPSQQFPCRNKSFGPAPRGASTVLPSTCPARARPKKGDGPARGERGRPERPVPAFSQACPPASPHARDGPRQEELSGGRGERRPGPAPPAPPAPPPPPRLTRRRRRAASPAARAAARGPAPPANLSQSAAGSAPARPIAGAAAGAGGGTWRALRGRGATRQAPSRQRAGSRPSRRHVSGTRQWGRAGRAAAMAGGGPGAVWGRARLPGNRRAG